MRKVIITTDPTCLVGDQHIHELSKTGYSKRKVHPSTLVGYSIIGVEESITGEIVLVLAKDQNSTQHTEYQDFTKPTEYQGFVYCPEKHKS